MVIKKNMIERAIKQPRNNCILLKLRGAKNFIKIEAEPDNELPFKTLMKQLHYKKINYTITINDLGEVSGFDYTMSPEAKAVVDKALGEK